MPSFRYTKQIRKTVADTRPALYCLSPLFHFFLSSPPLLEAVIRNVLQNRCFLKFRQFHRKTPVLESRFNKVAGLKACNFIKKRFQHSCFPVKFAKFIRTPFFKEHFWWLPLPCPALFVVLFLSYFT